MCLPLPAHARRHSSFGKGLATGSAVPEPCADRLAGAVADPAIGDKHYLVDRIKSLQRSSPEAKQQWWRFCSRNGKADFDPNRHDARFLQSFVTFYESAQLAASQESAEKGLEDKVSLVQRVKEVQRSSAHNKETWYTFCSMQGTANFDPLRHDEKFLRRYFEFFENGRLGGNPSLAAAAVSAAAGSSTDAAPAFPSGQDGLGGDWSGSFGGGGGCGGCLNGGCGGCGSSGGCGGCGGCGNGSSSSFGSSDGWAGEWAGAPGMLMRGKDSMMGKGAAMDSMMGKGAATDSASKGGMMSVMDAWNKGMMMGQMNKGKGMLGMSDGAGKGMQGMSDMSGKGQMMQNMMQMMMSMGMDMGGGACAPQYDQEWRGQDPMMGIQLHNQEMKMYAGLTTMGMNKGKSEFGILACPPAALVNRKRGVGSMAATGVTPPPATGGLMTEEQAKEFQKSLKKAKI